MTVQVHVERLPNMGCVSAMRLRCQLNKALDLLLCNVDGNFRHVLHDSERTTHVYTCQPIPKAL